MKLSEKKQQQLYNVISEEIMLARIEVAKITTKTVSTNAIN